MQSRDVYNGAENVWGDVWYLCWVTVQCAVSGHEKLGAGMTPGSILRWFCPVLQLFFEDSIDDAKYCGRLYGLGTGVAQKQNEDVDCAQEKMSILAMINNMQQWWCVHRAVRAPCRLWPASAPSRDFGFLFKDAFILDPGGVCSEFVNKSSSSSCPHPSAASCHQHPWPHGHFFKSPGCLKQTSKMSMTLTCCHSSSFGFAALMKLLRWAVAAREQGVCSWEAGLCQWAVLPCLCFFRTEQSWWYSNWWQTVLSPSQLLGCPPEPHLVHLGFPMMSFPRQIMLHVHGVLSTVICQLCSLSLQPELSRGGRAKLWRWSLRKTQEWLSRTVKGFSSEPIESSTPQLCLEACWLCLRLGI